MQFSFTKMQGAGNDFVVLDETCGLLGLTPKQYRQLADRHFGVGADQILSVRPASTDDVDFEYVIHNADGNEVEHCGNGARCFYQFVHERGLTQNDAVRVRTVNRVLTLSRDASGRVSVDMGVPVLEPQQVPFVTAGLSPRSLHRGQTWPLELADGAHPRTVWVAVASMGNPHAVQIVDNVDRAAVLIEGPMIERHERFPQRVNAGFLQIVTRASVRLRVFERGAGETLACGTGACAAVASGIQLGLLDACVEVQTRGGTLSVEWPGPGTALRMSGPAVTVFSGHIELPEV